MTLLQRANYEMTKIKVYFGDVVSRALIGPCEELVTSLYKPQTQLLLAL